MSSEPALSALAALARTRGGDEAFRESNGDGISYAGLLNAVLALSSDYRRLPATVGLMATGGIAWAAAQLALFASGRTVVALPDFFSRDQLAHIVAEAEVGHILTSTASSEAARGLGVPTCDIAPPRQCAGTTASAAAHDFRAGRLVIYTSGSTGRPKGVCIGAAQLAHSVRALAAAIGARPDDSYLSVLPISLLLEQICALYVPLRAGARVVFGVATTGTGLADLVERTRPTIMVLVPQLLAAWTAALVESGRRAPDGLRFVAVGGAPVGPALAAAAWTCGIPVHEGYGLSECCAVVALNRPGARAAGTVGHPLDGIEVGLDEGEVVVRGPTVMEGYVGEAGPGPGGVWRTGDLGSLDAEGRLIVHGRKDGMLVTPAGRNVVPEWIEAMVTADVRLAQCFLIDAERGLTAILVPHPHHAATFRAISPGALRHHVAGLVAAAPAYARPVRCLVAAEADLRRRGLLTDNGHPRRDAIAQVFAPEPPSPDLDA
jgi:long-subunit acyl-CoA synthetase (AMP-forming)